MQSPKQRPAHEIRLGSVKAVVWKNETPDTVRYKANFTRLYKDGEQWKESDGFGRDELLLLSKVADRVHSWIHDEAQRPEP